MMKVLKFISPCMYVLSGFLVALDHFWLSILCVIIAAIGQK
jgi:hypothetical protein